MEERKRGKGRWRNGRGRKGRWGKERWGKKIEVMR
jgi:hypothetical protein